MWCRNCNIETNEKNCPICGHVTEEDIPIEVMWCPKCRTPIVRAVNDQAKHDCPLCYGKVSHMSADLRPVFPEERLLLELLLDKKPNEYIETAPKILMSIEKIRTVYDLSVEEIREIQSLMSVFYDEPFFNGRSIWAEVENLPIVQKLQGNDWMLTCIMRQQDAVASLSVAGGIILSLESASLNLSRIWRVVCTPFW